MANSVSRNGFPVIFSSCKRGFLGFYIYIFSVFFPLAREGFLGFISNLLNSFLYFSSFTSMRSGFFERVGLC